MFTGRLLRPVIWALRVTLQFLPLSSFIVCFVPFFLRSPPVESLLPAWSLPAVLRALSFVPFEPMHKASVRDLSLKTLFFGGDCLGP